MAVAMAQPDAASPVLFFASQPVHPNETALVMGGADLSSTAFLRLCAGVTCVDFPPIDASTVSAAGVIPAGTPLDVYNISVCSGSDSCSAPLSINSPSVAWTQADAELNEASPGGWIRLFGVSLAFDSALAHCSSTLGGSTSGAAVRLVPASGGAPLPPITPSLTTCYAITAPIPPGTPTGDYRVEVNNGLPSCGWVNAATVTVKAPVLWPTEVFDVGALGVWGALAAAANNSGGVVRFPRGAYEFDANHTLDAIPPFTQLVGEGTDLVALWWSDMPAPPAGGAALIQGTGGHFAVRNVTIFVQAQFPDIISDAGFDGMQVTGCIIRADPYYMTLEPVNQSFHGRSMPVGSGINCGDAISVQGANWAVTDNDIFGGGSHAISVFVSDVDAPSWFKRPQNGVIARNVITGGFGMYRMEGVAGVVVEDNVMRGGGLNTYGSWVSTYDAKACEFLYFARNDVANVMGGDRELFSFDGGGGAYNGTVAATSADGRTLTLSADPVYAGYIPPGPRLLNYTGGAFLVLSGSGAGQVRRVVSNDFALPGGTNRSWVIDRPFDVPLDASSFVSIVPFRGNIIVAGNRFADGGAIQLYAMAIDVAVTENTAVRASSFIAWGLNPHLWGIQPNFRVSFLNNTVAVGNAWGGQTGGMETASCAGPADCGGGYSGPMNRAVIFRDNVLRSNAAISIGGLTAGVIVEHNTILQNAVGVAVNNSTTSSVVVRGNVLPGPQPE